MANRLSQRFLKKKKTKLTPSTLLRDPNASQQPAFPASKERLGKIRLIDDIAENVVLATIFSFFESIKWENVLVHTWVRFVIFPIATIMDILRGIVAILDLALAKNKNAGRTAEALVAVPQALLVMIAVLGALTAPLVFAVVTPVLFAATGAYGFLYNAVKAFANSYKYLKHRSAPEAQQYRQQIIGSAIGMLVTATLVTAVSLLMISPVGGVAMAAVAISSAVVLSGVTLYGLVSTFLAHRAAKRLAKASHANNNEESENLIEAQSNSSSELSAGSQSLNQPQASARQTQSWHDYYYKVDRIKLIKANAAQDRQYFLESEIDSKIEKLRNQITQDKGRFRLFGSEELKRADKISVLAAAKALLTEGQHDLPEGRVSSLKEARETSATFRRQLDSAFQSFFRDVGDVEDIIKAVDWHLIQPDSAQAREALQAERSNVKGDNPENALAV